ncbi:unnamed protein product [Dimorphilus gyrociliatus]|uniref:RING-type domain-containing protein n=1 Tax=Dimorphilus gyrociliatus TaxID=2664684 RepID=A0A7I8VBB5_9ANNE|nr:unnamed protein product [Dimorphilus gyrociliatus]
MLLCYSSRRSAFNKMASLANSLTNIDGKDVCGICGQKLNGKDPRMLACSHGFCKGCLHRLCKKLTLKKSDNFCCPVCKKIDFWPSLGCLGFPKMFYSSNDIRKLSKDSSTESLQSRQSSCTISRKSSYESMDTESQSKISVSSNESLDMEKFNKEIARLHEYLDVAQVEIEFKLQKHLQKAHQEIDRQGVVLKEKINNIFEKKRSKVHELNDNLESVKHSKGSDKSKRSKVLAEFEEQRKKILSKEISLKEYKLCLSDISTTNKAQLKIGRTNIQLSHIQYVGGMAIYNNFLFIAQYENMYPKKTVLCKYTLDGKFIEEMCSLYSEIAAIVINYEGNFFLSDVTNKQILHSPNGRLFTEFTSVSEAVGLSTYLDDTFVSSFIETEEKYKVHVYKFSSSGKKIWLYKSDENSVWKLASDQTKVVVIHPKDDKITILNTFTGMRMRYINLEKDLHPLGLCILPSGGFVVSYMTGSCLGVFDAHYRHATDYKVDKFPVDLTLLNDIYNKYIYINHVSNLRTNVIKAIRFDESVVLRNTKCQ